MMAGVFFNKVGVKWINPDARCMKALLWLNIFLTIKYLMYDSKSHFRIAEISRWT
jgi:hypothetical protein